MLCFEMGPRKRTHSFVASIPIFRNRAAFSFTSAAISGSWSRFSDKALYSGSYFERSPHLACLQSTPSCASRAIEAIESYYKTTNAVPYGGDCAHSLSRTSSLMLDEVRIVLSRFIGINDTPAAQTSTVFCPSIEDAWVTLARSLAMTSGGGSAVLVSSVGDAAIQAFQSVSSAVRIIPFGRLEFVARSTSPDSFCVVLQAVCPVTGVSNLPQVREAIRYIRNTGAKAKIVVDLTAALGRVPIDLMELGADLAVGNGSTLRTPGSMGFICGSSDAMGSLAPTCRGGGDVQLSAAETNSNGAPGVQARESRSRRRRKKKKKVFAVPSTEDKAAWLPLPSRLETESLDVSAVVGLGAALTLLLSNDGAGRQKMIETDKEMAVVLRHGLANMKGVSLCRSVLEDTYEEATAMVAFELKGALSGKAFEQNLGDESALVRLGTHGAGAFHKDVLNASITVQVSLYPDSHTPEDARRILQVLSSVCASSVVEPDIL